MSHPATPSTMSPPAGSALADVASILRLHIVGVAFAACLVFGWVLTGELPWVAALIGGVDWLLINLLNRVTDLREDLANGIRGTERVQAHARLFTGLYVGVLVGSFAVNASMSWELLAPRAAVALIGAGYSLRLVPTLKGLRRFKDLYFLKNFMSAVLFVLTCFVYPLVLAGLEAAGGVGATLVHPGGVAAALALVAFFVPFELTYEILYDLRDLDGDRLASVPTYPVVHGEAASLRIIDALLVGSMAVLLGALATGVLGLREGLMIVAPVAQWVFIKRRVPRGLTSRDCIVLTHLGTAQLLLFLAGTQLWLAAGLPPNVFLAGG